MACLGKETSAAPAADGMKRRDDVHKILELAARAPSGDNCQPWKFERAGQGEVAVLWDRNRAAHPLDAGDLSSHLALGALLESARLAAPLFGMSAAFELLCLDGVERARLRFREVFPAPRADPDAHFLSQRFVDRRPYLAGSLDAAWLSEWTKPQPEYGNCRLVVQGPVSRELAVQIAKTELLAVELPGSFLRTLAWIRFTRSEVESTSDGMPWWTLGVSMPESWALRTLRAFPSLFGVARALALRRGLRGTLIRNLMATPALFGLAAVSSEPDAFVHAGRLALRAWLRLTLQGWTAQPLSASSVSVSALDAGLIDPGVLPEGGQRIEFEITRKLLSSYLGLRPDEKLLWLLRTGRPRSPLETTARRPLAL